MRGEGGTVCLPDDVLATDISIQENSLAAQFNVTHLNLIGKYRNTGVRNEFTRL